METENFFPGYNPDPIPNNNPSSTYNYYAPQTSGDYSMPSPPAPAPAPAPSEPTNLCPKCGALNSVSSFVCSNCNEPLGPAVSNGYPSGYQQPTYQYGQPDQYGSYGTSYGQNGFPPPAPQPSGKKPLFKQWWFWLIIVLVGALILVGIIAASNDDDPDTDTSPSSDSYDSDYDFDYDFNYDYTTTAEPDDNSDSDYSPLLDSYYINMVKDATSSNYGNGYTTYGDAFDAFFSDPEWECFEATTGELVVEFEGGFYYDDVPTTAKIQFVLDIGAGEFSVYHLSFDGETQSDIMIEALLEKVFESY